MPLRQIAYVSAATGPLDAEEIRALVACCRRNNVRDDITGMLLAGGNGYVQVLEGPRACVMDLYHRVEDDPRHENLVLLHQDDIPMRAFPDCPMAFRPADAESIRRLEELMPRLSTGLYSMLTAEAAGNS